MGEEDGWDGGYEDLVDSGDGVEDLYLGNYQPYDMGQGFIPDPHFATRPSVPGRRTQFDINDVATPDVFTESFDHDRSSSYKSTHVRSSRPVARRSKRPVSKATAKAARRNRAVAHTASEHAISEEQVHAAVFGTSSLAERVSRSGLAPSELDAVVKTYTRTMADLATSVEPRSPGNLSSSNRLLNAAAPSRDSGSVRSKKASPESDTKSSPTTSHGKYAKQASLAAVGRKHDISAEQVLELINGPGSDMDRARRNGVEVSTIKMIRYDYQRALGQSSVRSGPKNSPKPPTVRRPALVSRGITHNVSTANTCGACGQVIRMNGVCGCS